MKATDLEFWPGILSIGDSRGFLALTVRHALSPREHQRHRSSFERSRRESRPCGMIETNGSIMHKCTALDAVNVDQTVATRWQPGLQFPGVGVGARVSH
jgi:hypothetical protein